jgi:hypothetical protein
MTKRSPRTIQPFDVVFDRDGNMSDHWYEEPDPTNIPKIVPWYYKQNYSWVHNSIFYEELEFECCYASRGSARFVFKSLISKKRYSMRISDFQDVMKNKKIKDGNIILGEFTFSKKGRTQGIRLIIE